jgi:hypothetical protein
MLHPEFNELRNRLRGIDSARLCYLAGRYEKRVVVPARQAGNRFLGFLKRFTNTGSGWPVRQIGLSYRPVRQGIDSWAPQKVYKYGLWSVTSNLQNLYALRWKRTLMAVFSQGQGCCPGATSWLDV